MKGLTTWNIFNGIAGLASIVSLGALLIGVSEAAKIVFTVLLILAAATLLLVSIKQRVPRAKPTSREAMIEQGEKVIGGVTKTLIAFGGDMSWASDYGPPIRALVDSGKAVVIIYPESDAQQVKQNVNQLNETGARLVAVAEDPRLRGFLVDPEERDGARFWLAKRRLRKRGHDSQAGLPGNRKDTEYVTREYRVGEDPELIDALLALYLVLCETR